MQDSAEDPGSMFYSILTCTPGSSAVKYSRRLSPTQGYTEVMASHDRVLNCESFLPCAVSSNTSKDLHVGQLLVFKSHRQGGNNLKKRDMELIEK
ncbi:hypothetical protein RRG08_047614 [Elysia crispata]|uniref:Uncharacterized protein n=1 Tax=Elysia crispata TaxID=231223 RepID=A0AAE1BEV0_9GAST|nr:hypothetical protein RRG08_047614 [Elysia crispata]